MDERVSTAYTIRTPLYKAPTKSKTCNLYNRYMKYYLCESKYSKSAALAYTLEDFLLLLLDIGIPILNVDHDDPKMRWYVEWPNNEV